MISNTNHDSSEGEQWGRYNLPRIYIYIYTLVGGFNNLEKYEFVNGKDYPIYYGK